MDWCEMDNENKFMAFLKELKAITGSEVLKGTMVYREKPAEIENNGFDWGE